MKKIFWIAACLLAVACGKNNNDNSSGGSQIAYAPDAQMNCGGYSGVNGYNFPQGGYQNIGYSPYQWSGNYGSQSGYCGGCPQGQMAACNPGGGLYCVPANNGYRYAQYGYGGGGYGFNGYSPYSQNSCSTGVGQICDPRALGTCGQYGVCQATGYGGYGVCTYGNGY